jgi:hypothetical protein
VPQPNPIILPVRARECWIAGFLALLLGVLVVGRSVWDGEWIYLATDTASVQAPWHATDAPRNAQLSDSGVAFYPHYRKVSERLRSGELPLWNPDLYAGVPLLANPQWGVLDPQVGLLVLLEALGGRAWFDWGFAWTAVLRLGAAALGAYLLARRMCLARPGAALAAVGYSLSGSVVLWLGFSLSHVSPCLPWVLLGVECLRRDERMLRGWLLASLALAMAIYGGHPELAFFVGFSAGIWSLTLLRGEARRARVAFTALACGVLLSAPVLLPFVEYLANSGALLAHRMAPTERALPDFAVLGAMLLFYGVALRWRRTALESKGGARALSVMIMALLIASFLFLASWRGATIELGWSEILSIEGGSLWLASPVLILALACALGGRREAAPVHALLFFGFAAWGLACSLPGLVDVWRWIPLVGLAAPERAACISALLVSLLAGFGLQHSGKVQRWSAGLGLLLFAMSSLWQSSELPAGSIDLDVGDSVVTYARRPQLESGGGLSGLAGLLHGGLRPDSMGLHFERLDSGGAVLEESAFVRYAQLAKPGMDGDQAFDFGDLDLQSLGPGVWRLRMEFVRRGKLLGKRFPALVKIPSRGPADSILLACALLTLLILAMGSRRLEWLLVGLALLQGWHVGHGWNPAVPAEQHLFPSKTEAFLAANYPAERFLAAPGILPGDTALLSGLTTIDGYDALDVASFDGFRAFAMKPGRNPLVHWNADGIDLESAAFRLLGVRLLLVHTRRDLPGWTLVAGPGESLPSTEVFVYEAQSPVPRAHCVGKIVSRADVVANPAGFDPRLEAFIEGSLIDEISAPFTESRVQELLREPELLEFAVDLDGEGLFVLAEQHFPGWQLWVDGESAPILRVNSILRGALLGAGQHHLRFEYRPLSWLRGKLLGLLGLVVCVAGAIVLRRA